MYKAQNIWLYFLVSIYVLCVYPVLRADSAAVYALYFVFPFFLYTVFTYFYDYSQYLLLILFVLPLSVNYYTGGMSLAILLPSEPLIGLACVAFGVFVIAGKRFPTFFYFHNLSLWVFAHLGLLGISVVFSALPEVSLKAYIVRVSYILLFYFILGEFFYSNIRNIPKFFKAYATGFIPAMLYIIYKHSLEDFSKDYAGDAPQPFFGDHTIYSACMCVLAPFFWVRMFKVKETGGVFFSWINFGLAVLFTTAIVIASSRAGWLSLALCIPFWLWLRFRLPFTGVLLLLMLGGAGFAVYQDDIFSALKINRADSNAKHSTVEDQLKSVTNVRSDVSNMERLNRWSCAIRMAEARPLIGFGFGTYQFTYLPFQRKSEMTPISVTQPFNHKGGRGGNAHSEFFGQMAEVGYSGLFVFTALVLYAIYIGMQVYYTTKDSTVRQLALAALLGLLTYLINGFFNSFLNTDKAAALFWGSLAMLAALQAHEKKQNIC